MPLVRSIDVLSDGFRIVTTRLTPLGMFVAVHLTSVVPLRGTAAVSNEPITGSWWL